MKLTTTRACFYIIVLFFGVLTSYGQIMVTNEEDSGPGSLRDAVQKANNSPGSDEIIFDADYNIALISGEIMVTDDLIITGNGLENSIIDGSANTGRIFNFQIDGNLLDGGSSKLQEITLNGGTVSDTKGGGALLVEIEGGTLPYIFEVINSEFNNNSAAGAENGGGAIAVNGATLQVTESTFTNNSATAATGSGGAIFYRSDLDFTQFNVISSIFDTNSAGRAGGAVEVDSDVDLLFDDVVFYENSATGTPGNGGAIHVTGAANATFTGGIAVGNSADNEGGAIWNGMGTMTLSGIIIDSNNADGDNSGASGGGGIYNAGGDIIALPETMIINNLAVAGASGSGGGMLLAGGSFTATETSITGNFANGVGGGIEMRDAGSSGSFAALSLTDCFLDGNNAGNKAPAPGNGGGLHITGAGSSTISGGTISGNAAGKQGGGIWNGNGTMTIEGTIIDANYAEGTAVDDGGGGIYNDGGTLKTDGASITNNFVVNGSASGGGLLIAGGSYSAKETIISENQSNRAGGGIEITNSRINGATAAVTFSDTEIDNNETGYINAEPGNGGGLHVSGASNVTFNRGSITRNTAAREGGGIWNGQGILTINGTLIDENDAKGNLLDGTSPDIVGGGGIFAEGGKGIVRIGSGTLIINNLASGEQGSGGGILMAAGTQLTIDGTEEDPVIIADNAASRAGGGLEDWSQNTRTNKLTHVNFMDNTAGVSVADKFLTNGGPGNGGALHVTGSGNNTITGGIISGNLAANEGGALWNGAGTMQITKVIVDDNTARGTNGGGGIFNEAKGTLDLRNSTVSNNFTEDNGNGAGIFNQETATLKVTASTISGNVAAARGGGIFNKGIASVLNATITNNAAVERGGGVTAVSPVLIKGSIIAENIGPVAVDVDGTFVSKDFNLIGNDNANAFQAAANDMENVAPLLGELADNGGLTWTHMLLEGSPAINAGDTNDNAEDQLGNGISGSRRDIGALEVSGALGIDANEHSLADILLYPNPSSNGIVSIKLPIELYASQIRVVDLAGKQVHLQEAASGTIRLDLSKLSAGTYFIGISNQKTAQVLKFLKSR